MNENYFFFFLCISSNVFAQNLPLDFENNQDNFTGFGGCTFYSQPDPSDASNTVGVIQNAGNDLYSGLYIVSIKTNETMITKRLVVQ